MLARASLTCATVAFLAKRTSSRVMMIPFWTSLESTPTGGTAVVALIAKEFGAPVKLLPLAICGMIVNVRTEEFLPRADGFATETCALPAKVRSEAEIVAVNSKALPNETVLLLP